MEPTGSSRPLLAILQTQIMRFGVHLLCPKIRGPTEDVTRRLSTSNSLSHQVAGNLKRQETAFLGRTHFFSSITKVNIARKILSRQGNRFFLNLTNWKEEWHCINMNIVQKLFSRERGSKRSRIMYPDISHKTVPRMDFIGSLNHEEAEAAQQINCIAFSPTGRFLVSGSYFLTLWDMYNYEKGTILPKTQLPITQVTVMTDERKIMLSLSNGEVFVAHMDGSGEIGITKLGSHLQAVSGLIRDISNPNLGYSCGDDGFIKRFDIRSPHPTSLLKCYRFENSPSRSLKLNGILQNPDDPQCITVSGDDAYIRLYDLRWLEGLDCLNDVYLPHDLVNRSSACIKGIAYSSMGQLLASCNNQKIYMFQREMGLGPKPIPVPLYINAFPLQLSEAQVYQGHTVDEQRGRHDITFFGPEDEYIASGSACGRIFFWNKREPHRVGSTESDLHTISCMTKHPRLQTPILATGGEDQHVCFWAPKLLIG